MRCTAMPARYRRASLLNLPAQYHGNVNHEPPLDRKPGDAPALSKSEIDDVIAFLETLTDADAVGLVPSRP